MSADIRNSAKALVLRDGKILLLKLCDSDGEWFILPGGGQESCELLPDAVCRHVREDTGVEVSCQDLIFVMEGSQGENYHRIDFIFSCEYISEGGMPTPTDEDIVGYEWIAIEDIPNAPLYPSVLRKQIIDVCEGGEYKRYIGVK